MRNNSAASCGTQICSGDRSCPRFTDDSFILAVCVCSSCAFKGCSPAAGPLLPPIGSYAVSNVLHVGGEGRWDYMTIDPRTKILYVPRQTHTQMILAATGQVVADVQDTPGVHGVALVPELHRAFTSNGQGNSVTVFDLDTGRVLGTIATGREARRDHLRPGFEAGAGVQREEPRRHGDRSRRRSEPCRHHSHRPRRRSRICRRRRAGPCLRQSRRQGFRGGHRHQGR